MKSYFADAVEAAMAQARKELGPDAVLVTNRLSPSESKHLGRYEVVFATELPEPPEGAPLPREYAPPAVRRGPAGAHGYDTLAEELRDLREQIEAWRNAAGFRVEQPDWIVGEPALESAFADLISAEVTQDTARQLIAAAQRRIRTAGAPGPRGLEEAGQYAANDREPLSHAEVRAALADEMKEAFQVDSSLGEATGSRKMVALVGPPGAGKTAMIAKLAVAYGLRGRRPALLVSLDTLRVAAAEQLRWYASILGLAFQVVSTNRALAQTLEEHRNKELILIDTPGFTLRDLGEGTDDADYLAGRADIQKHLVLPASMRPADMARVSSVYRRMFAPSRLIFTRMDEAGAFGPVLCEAIRSELPISFFGVGQRVPEDFEPARKTGLLERILPEREWAGKVLSAA